MWDKDVVQHWLGNENWGLSRCIRWTLFSTLDYLNDLLTIWHFLYITTSICRRLTAQQETSWVYQSARRLRLWSSTLTGLFQLCKMVRTLQLQSGLSSLTVWIRNYGGTGDDIQLSWKAVNALCPTMYGDQRNTVHKRSKIVNISCIKLWKSSM